MGTDDATDKFKCCRCCTTKVTIGVLIGVGSVIVTIAACFMPIFDYVVAKVWSCCNL